MLRVVRRALLVLAPLLLTAATPALSVAVLAPGEPLSRALVEAVLLDALRDQGDADGFELRLEQRLVDLPLVDRDRLLDAESDDLLTVDSELLRQLLGRQVVRHGLLLSLCAKRGP